MQDLHILATPPSPIEECKQHFQVAYPKYGNGTVELTPSGDYYLSTYGITEGAARRTQEYKNAYNKVSMDMLHAYEMENRCYTSIHKKMENVLSMSAYRQELANLAPTKYQRASFSLPQPTRKQVEEDLKNEFRSIHFGKLATWESYEEQDFIATRLEALTEARRQVWQEACDFFTKLEDAKEERANSQYFSEYKSMYNQKKAFLEGEEESVKSGMREVASTIQIPYNLTVSWSYDKSSQQMNVSLVMEDGISIPVSKASMLASGKISIKNKLVREMIAEKTQSVIGLVYYLGSKLYGVSPNIQYLGISLYDCTRYSPLLWVEFDRTIFSEIRPEMVDVLSDILGYPHVWDLKKKGEAWELAPMTVTTFERARSQAIQEVKRVRL